MERQERVETNKLKVSLVTAERLRWLQDLRTRVSTYYADAEQLTELLIVPVDAREERQRKIELNRLQRELRIAANNITLMLSPLDSEQQKLIDQIKSTRDHVSGYMSQEALQPQMGDIAIDREEALASLTKVGSEAWRQVQALE